MTTSAPDSQVRRIIQGINGRRRPKINRGARSNTPIRFRTGAGHGAATPRRNFRLHWNRVTLKAAPHRSQGFGSAYLRRRVFVGSAYWPQEVTVKSQSPTGQTPLDMIRPVLWMAAAAFAAGFGGYLVLGLRAIQPVAN